MAKLASAAEDLLPPSRRSVLFVSSAPNEIRLFDRGLEDMRAKWRLEFATDGPNALAWLKELAFDAVVVDLLATGYDGVGLLENVAEWRPEALRVALSTSSEKETVRIPAAAAHQFVSKPWDPKVLKAVLARAFASQEFAANEHFRRLLSGLQSLPALPEVYQELEAELRSDDPSLERAGEIISRDMAMTAKLLQLVNSAFFGLGRPMTHPLEAAMFLGTETLQALVLSIQVFNQFARLKPFKVEALWRHSWTTGVVARQICEMEEANRECAGHAFIAGLLHDVGKLVVAANQPESYRAAWQLAHRRGISFWEAEFQLYRTSHAELGGYLLARWGLPDPVVQAAIFHHRPGSSRDKGFSPLTAVHAANVFSKEEARDSDAVSQPVDVDYLQCLGLGERLEQWQNLAVESMFQAA